MLLQEARDIVSESVLHEGAGDASNYSPQGLDRAIQFALSYLVNETRCIDRLDKIGIRQGEAYVDVTRGLGKDSGFMPGFVSHFRIGDNEVQLADFEFVRNQRLAGYDDARPQYVAFETKTDLVLAPTPNIPYELNVAWHPPFIQWSPGTQAAVDLNVPDRFVREALWYGAGTALVYGEPVTESSWAATGWQRFLEYVERVKVMTGTHTERAESVNQSQSQRQPTLLAERRLRLQKG